jgi:hypothetical protein
MFKHPKMIPCLICDCGLNVKREGRSWKFSCDKCCSVSFSKQNLFKAIRGLYINPWNESDYPNHGLKGKILIISDKLIRGRTI